MTDRELDIVFTDGALSDLKAIAEGQYHGFTYPPFLCWRPVRWLWKKFCCPRNMHIFDECLSSSEGGVPSHKLCCDACDLIVGIGVVMTSDEACRRIDDYYDALSAKAAVEAREE